MKPLLLLLLLAGHLSACATAQPPRILPLQVSKRPPDPRALRHYIDAKIFEMKGKPAAAAGALLAAIAIDSTSATLYKSLCRNLISLNRHAEAVGPSRRAVFLNPKDLQSRWIHQTALLNGAKDTVSALQQLRTISRLDPNPLPAYSALLQIYSAQSQSADVLEVLERMETLPNLDAQTKLVIADQYARNERPDLARSIYEKMLSKNPHQPAVWGSYGNLILASGDTLRAAKTLRGGLAQAQNRVDHRTGPLWRQLLTIYASDSVFSELLSESGPNTLFLETLATVYIAAATQSTSNPQLSRQQVERAEALLDKLIGADSGRHDLLARRAELLLITNQPQAARSSFQQAFAAKKSANYWFGIGRTYLAERLWDQAIQALLPLFNEAPNRSKLYPEIVNALGRAYAASGRVSDARGVYRKAVEAFPQQPRFRLELGRTFGFEKSWDDAIPIFEELVRTSEDDPELFLQVLFELSRSYERAGHLERSIRAFQRLLTLSPENHLALNYLGYMLAEKGIRLKEAERLIERALRADPNNGAYLDSMGWVSYRQGQHRKAIEFLQRALDIEEKSLQDQGDGGLREDLAVIHDHTGDVARALGDHDKALRHWSRALKFDPENDSIRKKLQRATDGIGGAPAE